MSACGPAVTRPGHDPFVGRVQATKSGNRAPGAERGPGAAATGSRARGGSPQQATVPIL